MREVEQKRAFAKRFATNVAAIGRGIVQRLDGTNAEYAPISPQAAESKANGARGQSVVEMALITPILIILFAGLVEIGWFANNYLTLLDVTRAGARRGTTLTGEFDPTIIPNNFDERGSYVPPQAFLDIEAEDGIPANYAMAYSTVPAEQLAEIEFRWQYRDTVYLQSAPAASPQYSTGCLDPGGFGNAQYFDSYYNKIICLMLDSMEPLEFGDVRDTGLPPAPFSTNNGVDDIIVSGFAIENINADYDGSNPNSAGYPGYPVYVPPADPQPDERTMVVVGRWPTNANECDVVRNPDDTATVAPFERDPFDWNDGEFGGDLTGSGAFANRDIDRGAPDDLRPPNISGTESPNSYAYIELDGFDAVNPDASYAEKQRGFVWFGNHLIPGTYCNGSEWEIRDVEELFNLPDFSATTAGNAVTDEQNQRRAAPGQGMVLVEMYWDHRTLLQIPVLNPVFDMLTSNTPIYVWAAFPAPVFEPNIYFYCDQTNAETNGDPACSPQLPPP